MTTAWYFFEASWFDRASLVTAQTSFRLMGRPRSSWGRSGWSLTMRRRSTSPRAASTSAARTNSRSKRPSGMGADHRGVRARHVNERAPPGRARSLDTGGVAALPCPSFYSPGGGLGNEGSALEQEGSEAVQDDAGGIEEAAAPLGQEDPDRGVELRHRRPAGRDRPRLERVHPIDDLPPARPREVSPHQDRQGPRAHRERLLRRVREVRGGDLDEAPRGSAGDDPLHPLQGRAGAEGKVVWIEGDEGSALIIHHISSQLVVRCRP